MKIGCPKEIKAQEGRVGLTPAGVDALVRAGHTVYVETNAGAISGFTDAEYVAVGAQILPLAKDVYDAADMIIKVKEPLEPEYELLKEGQILFTYLHLAQPLCLQLFLSHAFLLQAVNIILGRVAACRCLRRTGRSSSIP